uniref:Cilia- and flagella-associated protein 52 n=1 Tax=Petromyzon marinus TaxID=7757 RepID=S4RY15_PETMA
REEATMADGQGTRLELESVIGFNGQVPSGLVSHPDCEHLLYPLGCTVVIRSLKGARQSFLHGHTNNVSCLAVSNSGHYVASGQVTYMGFKADVILWNFEKRELHARLTLHKVKVEALAFSPNDLYLASLGGQDDGSVVIWNVTKKEAVCGNAVSLPTAGTTNTVRFTNTSDLSFITAGNDTIRVWQLDIPNRKIRPTDCQTGQLKRIIKCVAVAPDDSFFYCGTTSGDILKVNLKTKLLNSYGPAKNKLTLGVTALSLLKSGELLVGTGDGVVALCKEANFKTMQKVALEGAVTSISLRGQGHQFFAGTAVAQIYQFNLPEFTHEMIATCHSEPVNDVAFPFITSGTSELFATCSSQDIRVWHTQSGKELLRITVPNMTCHSIQFARNGKNIVSGWNDGKIRAFTPESGRLMYIIDNAHGMGVTTVSLTGDCKRIISGGVSGQVRVWELGTQSQRLVEAMKEHKSSISCIRLKHNDKECVSASTDGTCIIWDLERFVRKQIVMANTLFKCACYHPEEFQIITSGTDRKIGFWEVFDGSLIRELEASQSGSINGMDVSPDGEYFVTVKGGDDKLIKVWSYNDGDVTFVGKGHSGNVTRLCVCPNRWHILSVSTDGAILRWRYPHSS